MTTVIVCWLAFLGLLAGIWVGDKVRAWNDARRRRRALESILYARLVLNKDL